MAAGVRRNPLAALILGTALLRLAMASLLGLGVDESYMVAAGRQLQWGYFDHPPLSWWLAWAAAQLGGTAAPVVRLPFILLFALSTWLVARLGTAIGGPRAGFWAAVLFNLSPVFGLVAGGWVLPDGPLDCALLAAACCLLPALDAAPNSGAAWRWWLGAGACAGLALFAKYSASLTLAGAVLYLMTSGRHRAWLARPQPWVAGLLALGVFAPVLGWNATHGFASFAFQGSRAMAGGLHPLAPFVVLGGEAVFLLPWIWLPLVLCFIAVARRGPPAAGDAQGWRPWLFCCLGVVPVVVFCAVALWSAQRVLFHWAAPGYLFLLPLLGDAVAQRLAQPDRAAPMRRWLAGTAIFVLLACTLAGTQIRWNWVAALRPALAQRLDPDLQIVDWTDIGRQLAARGLLGRPNLVLGAVRWHDAGKLDYALDGQMNVICLGNDPREYGLARPAASFNGDDVLIAAPGRSFAQIAGEFGGDFAQLAPLPPLVVRHAGQKVLTIPLALGIRLALPPAPRR